MPLAAQTPTTGPWYERALVGMEIGPTGAQYGHSDPDDTKYCADWDGAEIVRHAVAAHAQYLVLWLRDGDYAYYDSALLKKAPGLQGRNPLRDAVREARQCDLPLISYCVVQQGGHFLDAHPQWQMRTADGQPIGRFCFNSGYLAAMKQIVAEQLAYGIDGFHIDMLDQGFSPPYGCWCPTCKARFEDQYGHPMPQGATWDAAWDEMLEFRYQSTEQFEQDLAEYIKSINPEVTVDYNYHGNPPFSFEVGQRPVQHANNADFVTGETGMWAFSVLGVGLNAQFYRAATPGRRYQVAIQRGVRGYHDQTTRPLNDMRWELFTLLAHGAFVTMVDKTGFDGWLDPVAYRRIGQLLSEAQEKAAHFGHEPVYDVGLYFSSRTRDWMGREQPETYFQSFQGAHQTCVMEHLQFGVLLDENATLESLQRFPVVCLPNVTILSTTEVERLRNYVSQGGRLIITGQTAQRDRYGIEAGESALADLVGAQVVQRLKSLDNWIQLTPPVGQEAPEIAMLSNELPTDAPFLVLGPATVYRPTSADPYGQLFRPFRTSAQRAGRMNTQSPLNAGEPAGPALLVNRIGKGIVVTIAASPDYATSSNYAIVEARRLLCNAMRPVLPPRRVEIIAPSNVEAVVTDDPQARKLRVHLVAYNPTPRSTPAHNRPFVLPGLIEDVPMFRATLTLQDLPKNVTSLNPQTQIKSDGKRIEVVIDNIYEVVIVDY